MTRTYKVPVYWQAYGVMTVEAEDLEEAKTKAILVEPLPNYTYVEDSIEIDEESITLLSQS